MDGLVLGSERELVWSPVKCQIFTTNSAFSCVAGHTSGDELPFAEVQEESDVDDELTTEEKLILLKRHEGLFHPSAEDPQTNSVVLSGSDAAGRKKP